MAYQFLPTDYELASELLEELSRIASVPSANLVDISQICLNYLQNSSLTPQHFLKELDEVEMQPKLRERTSKLLLLFFKFAGKKMLSRVKVEEDLQRLGFDEAVIERIGEMWEEQKIGVCKVLIGQMGAAFNLLDLEWKFGVTVGNKIVDSKGECFIQMKLIVQDSEMKINEIFMEITPGQFYEFYGELEKIKSIMEIHS